MFLVGVSVSSLSRVGFGPKCNDDLCDAYFILNLYFCFAGTLCLIENMFNLDCEGKVMQADV